MGNFFKAWPSPRQRFGIAILLLCSAAIAQPPPDLTPDTSSGAAIFMTESAFSSLGVRVNYHRSNGAWAVRSVSEPSLPLDAFSERTGRRDARGRRNFLNALPQLKKLQPIHLLELSPANLYGDSDIDRIVSTLDLKQLVSFRVESIHVADSVQGLIKAAPNLQGLFLSNTDVDSSIAEELSRREHLSHLDLSNTQFDDDGIAKLLGTLKLEFLLLSGTKISDKAVSALAQNQTKLRELNLSKTHITDASVPFLTKLRWLQQLDLSETGLTKEAMVTLKLAKPNCTIGNSVDTEVKGHDPERN